MTKSENGRFGAANCLNTPVRETTSTSTPTAGLRVCQCDQTVNESQKNCPRCGQLTESALPLLLD